MSAYRIPEPQPLLSHRFERVLPGLFTRVRISEKRVRIDAPDVMALVTVGMVLQLLVPVIAHWSWLWAFAFSASVLFTLRIHLRVTKGKVARAHRAWRALVRAEACAFGRVHPDRLGSRRRGFGRPGRSSAGR